MEHPEHPYTKVLEYLRKHGYTPAPKIAQDLGISLVLVQGQFNAINFILQ